LKSNLVRLSKRRERFNLEAGAIESVLCGQQAFCEETEDALWTHRGAHFLLQSRLQFLNGDIHALAIYRQPYSNKISGYGWQPPKMIESTIDRTPHHFDPLVLQTVVF